MTSVSLRRAVVLTLALSALAALPRSAPAQIGGLIKKKIATASGQDKLAPSTGDNVAFDNITLELTPERLGKVIAGKQAGNQIANSPTGAKALREKRDALDEQLSQLREKNSKVLDAWDERKSAIASCRDSAFQAITEQIGKNFQLNAMSDPTTMQKLSELSMQISQAMSKGDTALTRKLTEQGQALMAPKPTDTLAVDRKCGSDKDAPPAAAQAASLQKQIDQSYDMIRGAEVAERNAELKESGLTDKQLAVACERIQLFVQRQAAKQRQTGLTSTELSALKEREKDLKDLCT
jgi:hypothetical protein